MVFSGATFLFYFLPLFMLVYFLADVRYKNGVILAGSMLFYAWSAPRFLFVILGTTVIDYFVVQMMDSSPSATRRKALLVASVSINLGLLFYFKYCGFFIDNVNSVLQSLGMSSVSWTAVALPVGISFYTFETITYVVDVYRRVHKPLTNFGHYLLYIIFFPKLIAGPIIRFHEFAGQITGHLQGDTYERRLRGFTRFVLGLSKKVLIANALGAIADDIFSINDFHRIDTATAWTGALAYTFQIYFDFSGYSDMALGLGQIMGFSLPENFNNPYTATSITDFWRRWHMTLGAWMRNYLYIPLGGNRTNSKWRLYFNLWIVFVASGLWHGAAWAFLIWGMYHGLFLVLERAIKYRPPSLGGVLPVVYSFVVVAVGWVFFRLEEVQPSLVYLSRMFQWYPANHLWFPEGDCLPMFLIAGLFSFFTLAPAGLRIQQKVYYQPWGNALHILMTVTTLILLAVCAFRITSGNFNPFIYFRF